MIQEAQRWFEYFLLAAIPKPTVSWKQNLDATQFLMFDCSGPFERFAADEMIEERKQATMDFRKFKGWFAGLCEGIAYDVWQVLWAGLGFHS